MDRPEARVLAAAELCRGLLAPHTDRDWRTLHPSADEMSVWDLVFHVDDVLYFYAAQVLLADRDDYVCVELATDAHATPARLLAALDVNARLLAGVVASADPTSLAHHTYGASDPAGFAAMGVLELLVHTWDALRALDPDSGWRPPDELAAGVLDRLFAASPAIPGHPAGEVLLHRCGRTPLGDRPQLADWRWDGSPLTRGA